MILHDFLTILRFLRVRFKRLFRHSALEQIRQGRRARTQPDMPPRAPRQEDDSHQLSPEELQEMKRQQKRQSNEKLLARLERQFMAKQDEREARQLRLQQQKANADRPQALPELSPSPRPEEPTRQEELKLEPPMPAGEDTSPLPPLPEPKPQQPYQLPPLQLLSCEDVISGENQELIAQQTKAIQDTLDSFCIDAEVTGHLRGPRVTLYKITVAMGVKVTVITTIQKDLCMALAANAIRILAPMPGHDYVGLEVPNPTPDLLRCGSAIASPQFTRHKGLIPIVLGRNIEGRDIVYDLARAPHLMVAGATGSGKSVCLNNILMSLLYRFTPDELQLILVDPKVVEFSVYRDIPHLIVPVITEVDLVVLALRWVIDEMKRRYEILALAGVRNLESYNARPHQDNPPLDAMGNPIPEKMPFIVVIIDELADIMLTAKQDVESSLARIAQLSRAVGIHCIIATQRPSVNVITGVIKANFPARIAFQVSSHVDSRTIIDGKGAEKLLGRGDMLFKSSDSFRMQRIQGALVTDQEIQRVADFCAQQRPRDLSFDLIKSASASSGEFDGAPDSALDSEEESLIRAAIEIIVTDQRASTSYLQRRLKIGYNKAASLMEILEQRNIVGPQIGSSPREIIPLTLEEALGEEDDFDEA